MNCLRHELKPLVSLRNKRFAFDLNKIALRFLTTMQIMSAIHDAKHQFIEQGENSRQRSCQFINGGINMVKIGIIGIGNMGSKHLKNIVEGKIPGMEVGAVCDISEERKEFAEKNYKDVPFFKNAEDMYKSGLINAVVIAVPHYDHPQLAIKAFEAGLDVICEKPAGVYTKQVLEMNEAAEKSGKVFSMMYNQRTNVSFRKIKELIDRGDLGNIKRISWIITNWYRPQAYHDSSSWRSNWKYEGGGALINQNPHQLDLWQWMFGMPDKIFAKVSYGKYYDIEVEDDLTAFFEYDNGITGTYIASTGEAPGTNRLEIACDMGKVVIENNQMIFHRNIISEREHNKNSTIPFEQPECWKCEIPVDASGGKQHAGILEDFAAAVLHGKELLAKGEEGLNGLTISNAMHISSWTGETVDVNNFPDDKFYELLQEKIKNSTVDKSNIEQKISDTSGTY